MRTSEQISNIAAALLAAQKNIGAATKGAKNPFFSSKYADLGSVMEACKEALNNEGISVLQPVLSNELGDYVETVLLHSSGEFIASSMKLVLSKQDMQAYGSAVSYARRYSLQSLVFIPAEDDDGESTMARQKANSKAPGPKKVESAPLSATELVALKELEEKPKGKTSFRNSRSTAPAAIPAAQTNGTTVPNTDWNL